MADPVTIRVFLDRLRDRRVVPVGPREHLAAERLLRSRPDWPEADLRAALASLLSGSREEWTAVAAEYDAVFRPQTLADLPVVPEHDTAPIAPRPQQVRLEPTRKPSRLERWRARLRSTAGRAWSRARDAHRRWWVAGIAVLVAIPVAVAIALLPPPEQTLGPAAGGPAPDQPAELSTGASLKRLRTAETRMISVPLSPSPETIDTLIAIALIGLLLGALGIRLMLLPAAAAAARDRRAAERRAAAQNRRRQLDEQQAASRESLQIRYHVPEWPALSRQAILDSAELLGRLLREERGDQVDPLATLARTLAAGGRFTPVMRPRHVRQEVLLLVDVEQGDHPWLPGFLRVVDAWRRQGVRLIRYDFQMNPVTLADPETGEGARIDAVARRTEGLPLVIFSRGLRPGGRTGEAGWLRSLGYWPVRAWLDPDPRPLAEHSRLRRREIDALTRRHGLGRFPLSERGVVTMARWLAADGESPRAVDWSVGLAPRWQDADAQVREALRKWALAAALVPDPSWDQLESIRRRFPQIHRCLGERRDVQRLLDRVAGRTGADVELHGGRCLNIPEHDVDQWIREQREMARTDPAQRGFEAGVRRLLLAQLEPAEPPKDQLLEHMRWRLKQATHQAVIGEGPARALLGWAFDEAVAHEASRWVRRELDRQDQGLAATPFGRSDIEALKDLDGSADGVDLRELVLGHWRAWLLAALALIPTLLVLAYDPGRQPFDRIAHLLQSKTARVEARLPPIFALEQAAGDWVPLAGGSFPMGSEDGNSDERPVHRVEIAPFAIGRTEVTVAEYRRCVEAGVCAEPETGVDCNWGVKDRDRHPVNCVSWDQANTYADWVGARLPTEAEWEYAARGQGLDRAYPWGNEEANCTRAIVRDGGVGGCGHESTWPVCSKPAGNTPQGLCDMAGNLWEWVEDDYHDSYRGAPTDGSAWVDTPRASDRVIRGGSWRNDPRYARAADRSWFAPGFRLGGVGLRLARSLPSAL